MIKLLSKINKTYFWLFFIILLQVLVLVHYMSIRTVTHVDEIFSYGLANSYNSPFFWKVGDYIDSKNNFYNKWQDGSKWFNYITVQPNETFAFDKVYRNQSLDLTPPLYYFVLHFICSLFPNTFNLWYGQILNIIVFILTQFFLFKLTSLLFKNYKYSFAILIFYGFSMAAINTYIFIRMYAMLTMFCVILTYLILKITENEKISLLDGISLLLIGFLGFLTQHYFAFFFFSLSVGIILYFLNKKNYKLIINYLLIIFSSFIVYFSYFPYVFKQVKFESGNLTSHGIFSFFPFKELFVALSFIINYTLGIDLEILISFFRKLTFYLDFLNLYLKPFFVLTVIILLFWLLIRRYSNYKFAIIGLEFIITLILISCYTSLHMRLYFCRYYFALLPFACILEFSFIEWILKKIKISIKIKDFVIYTLIITFILLSRNNSLREYCYSNLPTSDDLSKLYTGSSIISVEKAGFEGFIHCKAPEYRFSKRVFPVREYEAEEINKAIDSIISNDKNYIVVPENEYGLLIINMLKKKGNKPRYLFTDNHPNYDQMVFEIYAKKDN